MRVDAFHHEASCLRGETLLLLAGVARGDVNGGCYRGETLHNKMAMLWEEMS